MDILDKIPVQYSCLNAELLTINVNNHLGVGICRKVSVIQDAVM